MPTAASCASRARTPRSCCRASSPTTWSCWPSQPAIHAALLTPQGKILFEFFVVQGRRRLPARDRARQGGRPGQAPQPLQAARQGRHPGRQRRLSRAGAVGAVAAQLAARPTGTVSFADPRLPALGLRILAEAALAADIAGGRRRSMPRRRTTTRTASRSACPRAARTMCSATPSRTRPTSTSSTASPSARAASSARRW